MSGIQLLGGGSGGGGGAAAPGPSLGANEELEKTIYTAYTTAGPGYLTPDDAVNVRHIYWRSNWTQEMPLGGEGVILGTFPGDDDNDGLTPETPIRTEQRLYEIATKASGLARIHVHMADAGSPNNGFDGGIDCPPLYYQVEELRVGGGAGNACSYTYSGPPRPRIYHPLGPLQTHFVTGSFPYGQSTLVFNPGHGVDNYSGIVGFLVCVQANGDYFVPPMPLLRHTDFIFYLPDGGETSVSGAGPPLDGEYFVGRAGVVVVNFRDLDPLITGLGCYRSGFQEKVIIPDPDAQNPRPTCMGIEFAGANVAADGISFDRCSFLDHPVVATGRRLEFKMCRMTGLWLHDASGRVFGWRNNITGNPTQRELTSYQPDGITTTHKTVGCDFIVTQVDPGQLGSGVHVAGGQRNVTLVQAGADDAFADGQLLIYKGVYGYGLDGGLINLYGAAQFGMCEIATLQTHNVPFIFKMFGKSEAQVWAAGIKFTGTNTTCFRIGHGTVGDPQVDVPLADFVNAALWNYNLCIFRPHVPANAFGAGVPAAAIFPYGCMARAYQGSLP